MTAVPPARAYLLALVLLAAGLALAIVAYGLPWLTLAVVLGIVATRGWARTVAAVILLIGGLVLVVAGATALAAGSAGAGWSGLAGGILVAAGSAWAVVRGRAWPAMGGRYERKGSTTTSSSRLSAWDALDRGHDPTDDRPEE